MSVSFDIEPDWVAVDAGEPEERIASAAVKIILDGRNCTEGLDVLTGASRQAPLLSAYHLAEWLAWNWWRIRYEPRWKDLSGNSADFTGWNMAHSMRNIGGGYIWPDITLYSDGKYVSIAAKSTPLNPVFRYLNDISRAIEGGTFEHSIDRFIEVVLARLREAGHKQTNLRAMWHELKNEREEPSLSLRRKLEALSGLDPDELGDEQWILWQAEVNAEGPAAFEEVVANQAYCRRIEFFEELKEKSRRIGAECNPPATVESVGLDTGSMEAYQKGERLATQLRSQLSVSSVISDNELGDLVGASASVFGNGPSPSDRNTGMSFALIENGSAGRIVFRSPYRTSKRFEAARLLCDRLAYPSDWLHPATQAYTYRQKLQRAFAAELLCPYHEMIGNLDGDYSDEAIQREADHFGVSPLMVSTQLTNHGILSRDELQRTA